MVFNSFTFILFFILVLLIHNVSNLSWNTKKGILLGASYLFYSAWNPPFVALLWFATLVDWNVAQWMVKTDNPAKKKLFLLISLVVNLGLLSYFKYGTFLLDTFTFAANSIGINYHPASPNIILPIGISFFTFVTLSYTIDVYRNEIPPSRSFLDFALLVTFFPHLVAGPILRAIDFLPQCEQPRRGNSQQVAWGLSLLIIGLFEKVFLADTCLAPVADQVFNSADQAGTLTAWLGVLAFAGQIFFDFDGYSLSAIGIALSLGFVFPDNFRFPYASLWFSDFWRRWHISLSSWLRDYLYIPLGGNRKGKVRNYINLMLTMLIGGLWHGSSWLFVVWGGLHGLFLVIERLLKTYFADQQRWANLHRFSRSTPAIFLGTQITFVLVCLTWIFFRCGTMSEALHLINVMFTGGGGTLSIGSTDMIKVVFIITGLLTAHWCLRKSSLEQAFSQLVWPVRSIVLAILLFFIFTVPGDNRAFIYFQF